MPGIMFQDLACSHAAFQRKWYTVPLSFLIHTSLLAIFIVVPLVATDVPRPREAMIQFVTPFVPVVPAPIRIRRQTRAAAPRGTGTPVVAPDTIGAESGVIFQPGHVDTAGIDNIGAGVDLGPAVIDAPPPSPPAAPAPVVVGRHIKPPTQTKYVMPEYPKIARDARIQAVVIIEAIIGADGRVEQAQALRSHPLLEQTALAAVKQWEYTPTLLNGRPTPVIMRVTVVFKLQ